MTDWREIERRLTEAVGPRRRPVAVAFRAAPPAGVPRFAGRQPSGCSFWRLAAEGRGFYTVPADHANCAIGSYTHNMLCRRLLGRPASGSGPLCHGGGGHEGGDHRRRAFMLPILAVNAI
jgi:hypothetical protein